MQLVERFWVAVTTFVNVITLSPFSDGYINQIPLPDVSVVSSTHSLNHVNVDSGPIFQPPGTIDASGFVCDYSAMPGWEPCHSEIDRSCWLRKTDNSEEPFDIFADYENRVPVGIVRNYTLDLQDYYYDADGLNFTSAKLFAQLFPPPEDGEPPKPIYPGPWIEACWGDILNITVKNSLRYNGTSVHWHGVRQNQTMHMDGVNGVTQCPIAPGHEFVYTFNVTQYGSSWYHSHYSVQYADGAAGPLTFHGPTSLPYDEAISPPLIMTDWGHGSAFDAVTTTGKGFHNKGLDEPDILLNGRGNITMFNETIPADPSIQPPYTIYFDKPVVGQPIKKYLLRLINTSFQTTFLFTIDNHNFTVVEADFVPVTPYSTNQIMIGIGQRYDVVIEAWPQAYQGGTLPEDWNFFIRTFIVDACFGDTAPPLNQNDGYEEVGILRYGPPHPHETARPQTEQWPDIVVGKDGVPCDDEIWSHLHPVLPWTIGDPSNGDPSDPFDINLNPNASAYPLAAWNLDLDLEAITPIRVNYSNITFMNLDNHQGWPPEWRIVSEDFNALETTTHWVYLVIQSNVGSHPIHLHGHDFAIIDVGTTAFNPQNFSIKRDNPPRRDVVLLPTGANGSGYAVIAFKADNPGAWLVHCHIAFHIAGGLGMQILEDQENAARIWKTGDSRALDNAKQVCDKWDRWQEDRENWWPSPDCKDSPDKCFQNDSGV